MDSPQVNPIVAKHIRNLRLQFPRSPWPRFLYHFSDIENVVSILETGKLLSRSRAKTQGLQIVDSAGAEVLRQTPDKFKDYARLYFRPRTPPLYRIEGFRQDRNRDSRFGAHCPVPVYLVFDAVRVLSRHGTEFSDMNVARTERTCFKDPIDLSRLDFDAIYHRGAFPTIDRERIIAARCAEVLVLEELPLERFLKSIVCRSKAERETLLNMLATDQRSAFGDRVHVYPLYFYCEGHFVDDVGLSSKEAVFKYKQTPRDGDFEYRYELCSVDQQSSFVQKHRKLEWKFEHPREDYEVRLDIDGHIAYLGRFRDPSNPFCFE